MDRKQIKEKAKGYFKANFWPTVAVLIIMALASGTFLNTNINVTDQGINISQEDVLRLTKTSGFLTLIGIFFTNIYQVGVSKFLLKNMSGTAEFSDAFSGFKGYPKNLFTTLLRDIFAFLWTLLLIFPGVMKMYSYFLVPYILAETGFDGTEAIRRSSDLMYGHRWELFKLQISFIGWWLLSAVTLGIVGVLYAIPYQKQAETIFAEELLMRGGLFHAESVENN